VNVISAACLLAALAVSGLGDARGFVHASRIWTDGFSAIELARSGAWFVVGIGAYWVALYWAERVGIVSPQIRVLVWFVATIIGVAAISGELLDWSVADKAAAAVLVALLVFLLVRHEA
jgi:hypothetical protein